METNKRKLPDIAQVTEVKTIDGSAPQNSDGANKKPFTSATKFNVGNNKGSFLAITGVIVAAVLLLVFVLSSKNVPRKKEAAMHKKTPTASASSPVKTSPMSAPGDTAPNTGKSTANMAVSADDVSATQNNTKEVAARQKMATQLAGNVGYNRSPYGGASGYQYGASQQSGGPSQASQNKPLNSVPAFTPPHPDASGHWKPPDYSGTSTPQVAANGYEENTDPHAAAKRYEEEVSKPSLTFVAGHTSDGPGLGSGVGGQARTPITNFGLEPGYHIAARTESVISTGSTAPPIAIIEYSYTRDGHVLIPAGSKVLGRISAANQSGMLTVDFTSMIFPDGTTVPISAVGLDRNLMPIKGIVTGRNRGKEFLVAAMAGLGEGAAMFAGGSNPTGAFSEMDMFQMQAAQNVGNAADMSIQQMMGSEHIVVTVPAGTPIYVTFTKSSEKK